MLVFRNIYDGFLAISIFFRIFAAMETKNNSIYFSDEEIYEGLLNEDEFVLNALFYGEQFNSIVGIIREKVLRHMEFDSLKAKSFNDLYLHLKEDNYKKLREYETEGGSILIWLARTAIKYYQDKRNNELKTEKRHQMLLEKRMADEGSIYGENKDVIIDPENDLEQEEYRERIKTIISMLEKENKKYADIMRNELLGENHIIESSNFSQEKKRAYNALRKQYFNYITRMKYEKE